MSTAEKLTGKEVAAELNAAHSPADLNKAFIDSIALKNGSTQSQWNEALATINAGVEMKRLGLDSFTIVGVGTDNGGHNILAVASKDGKEERLVGPEGEQYKLSADGKKMADLKKNVLTDSSSVREPVAAADVAPKTVAFGNRNRQMTINADGSDAVYAAKKGDNLWSVAKDYLQQQGKSGSDRDVANLVKTIARDNKIQNANHLDINEQIHLKPIKAAEAPAPKVTTPPEVAPVIPPAATTSAAPPEATTIIPPAAPAAANPDASAPSGAEATPPQKSLAETVLQDTKIVARIGIGYANEYLSPLISGMSAKIFMKKYGVKLLEAGLHGPGYAKVIAAAGLGVTAALGISEGLNATSVALGNESLSQANVLTNGLAGYGGMKAASALEARFANTKGLAKLAVGVTTGATEWSTYDLGKTNPFTINESTGRNYTVGETLGTLRRDLLGNAFFGLVGNALK